MLFTGLRAKGTRAVPEKQKASVKELVVDNSTQRIIRLLILTRFLCSGKENTVFADPKDRRVKYYYPNKKAVTVSTESGQKEFLRVQRNQQFFFKVNGIGTYAGAE